MTTRIDIYGQILCLIWDNTDIAVEKFLISPAYLCTIFSYV